MFFSGGLDRANQLDPAQQFRFYAQRSRPRWDAPKAQNWAPDAATGDSESFNQLVRTIPLRTKGCVMRNLDRVSGSFLAVVVGGLAVLCGGLIVIAIGY
jgi:hypothetical protein